jgi:hypothetical protein
MVEKIDFFTSFGHGEGGDHRARLGITTKGPTLMVTDLAVWKADPETSEFTVVSLHPGVTRDMVQDTCGWTVRFADEVTETPRQQRSSSQHAARSQSPHQRPPIPAAQNRRSRLMAEAFICDYIRTPIGRFGGALSSVRTDDLGAVPLRALAERNAGVDWEAVDEVFYGCANQAGEDNRNVARMSTLAGRPSGLGPRHHDQPALRLGHGRGSGGLADDPRGEADLVIAGGVESMSRAPFVMPKADTAFSRNAEIYDTTIGWRFVNPVLKAQYGVDSMPETGENVAEDFSASAAQTRMPLR